jgi:hypothetical protein
MIMTNTTTAKLTETVKTRAMAAGAEMVTLDVDLSLAETALIAVERIQCTVQPSIPGDVRGGFVVHVGAVLPSGRVGHVATALVQAEYLGAVILAVSAI